MAEYQASVEPHGKQHKIGPYRIRRQLYTDSDGSRHSGWLIWSGDYETGTGSRGLPLLTLCKHWRHVREEHQWRRRG